MTPSELKFLRERKHPGDHFFTPKTMKLFGDTMRNYGVKETTIETYIGPARVYELYRRHAVKHGLQSSAFFDVETLDRRYEKNR